jgi:hypothetical protein
VTSILKKEESGCSNYKLDMIVKYVDSKPNLDEERITLARCEKILSPTPLTLNKERYFGKAGTTQRDFSQLRSYRIDNSHATGISEINFTLTEEHT